MGFCARLLAGKRSSPILEPGPTVLARSSRCASVSPRRASCAEDVKSPSLHLKKTRHNAAERTDTLRKYRDSGSFGLALIKHS